LPIDPHFVRKGCSRTSKIAIFPQFLPIDPHFVRKGCSGASKLAIFPQFLPIDPHFVRKGCSGTSKIATLPQFSPIDPHFVRKGSHGRWLGIPSGSEHGLLQNPSFATLFSWIPPLIGVLNCHVWLSKGNPSHWLWFYLFNDYPITYPKPLVQPRTTIKT